MARSVIVLLLICFASIARAGFDSDAFDTEDFDENSFLFTATSVGSTNGMPFGWEPYVDITVLPEFLTLKYEECIGDGVWAKWLEGTDPTPRGSANCEFQIDLLIEEADGAAVWGRWAPGTVSRATGDLQINIRAAIAADFVPN